MSDVALSLGGWDWIGELLYLYAMNNEALVFALQFVLVAMLIMFPSL
jgi:hypothetical protein